MVDTCGYFYLPEWQNPPDSDTDETQSDGDTNKIQPHGDTNEIQPHSDTNEIQPDGDTNETQPDFEANQTQPNGDTNETQPGEKKKETDLQITGPSTLQPRIPMNICEYFSHFDDLFSELTATYRELHKRYMSMTRCFENLCTFEIDSMVAERYQISPITINLFAVLLAKNINSLRAREEIIREQIFNIQIMFEKCSRNHRILRTISTKGRTPSRAVRHRARRLLRVFESDLHYIKRSIRRSLEKMYAFYEQKHFVLYNLYPHMEF